MKRLAVVVLLSGCSAIFMERVPRDRVRGQVIHCTGTKGFVALDGAFVALNAIGAGGIMYAASSASDSDKPRLYVMAGGNAIFALLHLMSAASGSSWADECRTAHDEGPPPIEVTQRPVSPPAKDERKEVIGDKPLYCAVTAPDVGRCFLSEAACQGETPCEMRKAGSCFNATKILDGTKTTTCAVSIKDCETRREEIAANPDYKVTPCGIYRQRP